MKIPIVTKKWLYKSLENGSFLPIDEFLLPMFNELKIGVLGFSTEELVDIKKKIEECGGTLITNINDIMNAPDISLILLKASELKTYESFLHILKTPVVHESWLNICFEQKFFIRPEFFLIGHKSITQTIAIQKEMFNQEMKILKEHKLKKCMKEIDSGDQSYWFLSNAIIYFFNVEAPYEKILKDIVNLAGGYYINHYNISITHIITQHYQEEDFSNFKKIGNNFFILHPLWLKDCFFYKKKISEFEYYIMPGVNLQNFAPENNNLITSGRVNQVILKRTVSNDETFSFMERRIIKPARFSQENQFPLIKSVKEEPDKQKKKVVFSPYKREKPIEIKSFIFMNINFFMNTSDFKELKPYRMKILENSGKMIDNIKNLKTPIYYVLSDGIASLKIKAQRIEKVNYVSFRWVDYCIEKKHVVKNHLDLKLIHLSPLTFKMPLSCFKNSFMYVCGFATQEKIILKSLMNVMGITILFDM